MDTAKHLSPEDAVYRVAARLVAVQHAVAEIAGGRKLELDPRALQQAVFTIRTILRSIPDAHGVFIGGLAVQHHGYHRYTEDVDIVVDRAHFNDIMQKLREAGFAIQPDCTFVNAQTGAVVDVLQEGTTIRNARSPLPHPSLLGPNGGFADMIPLIQLKLEANRSQDRADVVSLLKRNMTKIDEIAASLPDYLRPTFQHQVEDARREME